MKCSKCQQEKSEDNFYKNKASRTGYSNYCKSCHKKYCKSNKPRDYKKQYNDNRDKEIDRNKKRRRVAKQELVELMGGKCSKCNYNKCLGALEFHHIDPSTKSFGLSEYITRYKKVTPEMLTESKKCELLCSNCHKEHHYED